MKADDAKKLRELAYEIVVWIEHATTAAVKRDLGKLTLVEFELAFTHRRASDDEQPA